VIGEACPGELEIARAMTVGAPAALAAHLAECAACRAAWDGLARAIELARGLPVEIPSAARRDEVRGALLATAQASPVRPARAAIPRAAWGVVGAAAAAAAIWFSLGGGGGRERARAGAGGRPHSHASVRAQAAADYALASAAPDELLRLRDGSIAIEVEPLGAGDRFRVVVGRDEIEVRGTAFELTATHDRLDAVHVTRGRVEVRPAAGTWATLGAGESWRPEAALSKPANAAPAAPPPTPLTGGAVAPPLPGGPARPRGKSLRAALDASPSASGGRGATPIRRAEESLYDDAWDAMRVGDFHKAAAGFAGVIAIAPAGALADEGAYWRAVALARAGSPGEAIAAFREMLDRYAGSPRRGEASAMLGWLLVDAHQLDEAARRFRAAAADPTEAVRGSARKGLEALGSPSRP
jgi:TolA-binding protein